MTISGTRSAESGRRMIGAMAKLALMCLLMIVVCGIAFIMHPAQAYAEEDVEKLNNSTGYYLKGSYELSEDIYGKSFSVKEDTKIWLNHHSFIGGEADEDETLFVVEPGCTLTIEGNGKDARSGILQYGTAFRLQKDSILEMSNLHVQNAYHNGAVVDGDNVTIEMFHSKFNEIQCNGTSGAICTSGDTKCDNLKIIGKLKDNGEQSSEIIKSDSRTRYGGGLHIKGDNLYVYGIKFFDQNSKREGGGIWAEGNNCVVENCIFKNNTTEMRGGGIFIAGDNAKVLTSTFEGNTAYYTSVAKSLLLLAPLCLSFVGDAATLTLVKFDEMVMADQRNCSGDHGGAVYIRGEHAEITDIYAKDNWANRHGGAVYVEGDLCNISKSTIRGSSAYIGGGAVSVKGSYGTISNMKIERSYAADYGGGIEILGNWNVISDTKTHECIAGDDGGGIYVEGKNNKIQNGSITYNYAQDYGGGVVLSGSENKILDSEVYRNSAKTDCGGGAYLEGSGHEIENTSFIQNMAEEDFGGALYTEAENTRIKNCTFRSNETHHKYSYRYAVKADGKYFTMEEKIDLLDFWSIKNYDGGAIYSEARNTSIEGSTFTENYGNDGGAIYFDGPRAKVKECTFKDNACENDGGAIYFKGSYSVTDTCTFKKNLAGDYGGAIYYDDVENTLKGSGEKGTVIEGNQADEGKNYGHGVFVDDTDITLGGKLIIRNNNNMSLEEIASKTNGIQTWSNLCLYDGANITVTGGSLEDSEVWIDSDWGHYKKPAGGYLYKANDAPPIKVDGFRSDRAGFHFIEKNDNLYYAEGEETIMVDDFPAPTVSVKPYDDVEKAWEKDPGRVYIDFDNIYENAEVTKNYKAEKRTNGGARESVKIENDGKRDYVDVTGQKGETVEYRLFLSYTVSMPTPTGSGTETKESEELKAEYKIQTKKTSSKVRILSAYESIGELVEEDLGLGEEGSEFDHSDMRYPVVNKGQVITGWKLRVDGETKDRDTEGEWDEGKNRIRVDLPDDLNGRGVLIIPQREAKKCKVEYAALSSTDFHETTLPDGTTLPENRTVDYGTMLTIDPVGKETGLRSIGSYVNGEATWGRDQYTVEVNDDTEIDYIFDDRENVTVTFDDEMMKAAIGEEKTFKPGQSFTAAGYKTADTKYQMNEIDHFQILHDEEKTDEDGNVIMDEGEPVTEGVYNDDLTLGVDEPMLGDYTLKPVWTQTVKLNVASRSTDGILAEEMDLEGGSKSGESITADKKTGEKVSITCIAPEGKRLAGWTVAYYTWHSAMSPGWIDSVATDSIKADGQKIASKLNPDREAAYTVKGGLEFVVNDAMKAVKTNTPLRINITPVFKDAVTGVTGVPEEINIGDVFDLSTVKVEPSGAATAADIEWTVNDGSGETELGGTFSPESSGAVMLRASVKDGLGVGTDYVQSFEVETPAAEASLVFYSDMAGTKIEKEVSVAEGSPLAEYADIKPSEDPEDYSFAGWTFEQKTEGEYSYKETIGEDSVLYDFSDEMPGKTLKLYPVFIRDRLRVELDLGDGGSEVSPAKFGPRPDGEEQSKVFYADINEMLQMDALNTATRPGFALLGWFTGGGVKCTDDWTITPKYCEVDEKGEPVIGRRDNFDYYTLKLTAKWAPSLITAKYVVDGKATEIKDAAEIGGKLVLADAPEETEDMIFDYWMDSKGGQHAAGEELYLDDSAVELIDENGVIEFTSWYTAKIDPMDPELNMIVFATAGGTYVASMRARAGAKIYAPEDPERSGYTFDGWKYDGYKGFPELMPASKMTVLTASWLAKESTIKFETNGGSAVSDVIAEAGTDIRDKKPEDPVREHYTFAGWMPEYPEVMPETDLILYALWMPEEYTLTYDANGGEFEDGAKTIVQKGLYDSLVFVAGDPVRKGYTFSGWDSETYWHMPGEDKTIKALWTKNDDPEGDDPKTGDTFKVSGSTYRVTSAKKKTVSLVKAVKSKKTFTLPSAVTLKGKKYSVTGITKKAFRSTKVKTITVKTKKLTKKSVKGSLKGSRVKTIKVKVGKKSLNKKYVKKYRKIFTKKNAGKKVTVK